MMKAVLVCGSRNEDGQTARAAHAVCTALREGGHEVVSFFLPAMDIERCRQCDARGWGECREHGRCVIQDDFEALVADLRTAHCAIFATPVYYSDLSESMRAFTDRLRRVCTHEKGREGIAATPAVGICVAGGGGGGAPSCCVSLEKVLRTTGFDVIDLIPVRRQNLDAKVAQLTLVGTWLGSRAVVP